MEKMSYAMGINVGEYVLKSPLPVKPELVLEGLKDCLAGAPGLPPEEYAKAMHELQAQQQQAGQDQMMKMAEGNSKAGKEFLEANAKKTASKSRQAVCSIRSSRKVREPDRQKTGRSACITRASSSTAPYSTAPSSAGNLPNSC